VSRHDQPACPGAGGRAGHRSGLDTGPRCARAVGPDEPVERFVPTGVL
jgi:hypothetical protein